MKTVTTACLLPYTPLQRLLGTLLSLPAILALSVPLLLTACGGKASSAPGSTSTGPTPGTANEWTWMSGSNVVNASGVYGTRGVAAPSNIPGARDLAVSWTDSIGNLWLFGGEGYDSTGAYGPLNDVWELNPTNKEWTWVGDSSTRNATGVYGTMGTAAPSNVPGGRAGSVHWIDGSGNLWLLGGYGYDSTGTQGYLNDLWELNFQNGMWTWMGDSKTANAIGVYGTMGTPAPNNVPGGRDGSVSWIDGSGNLWLLGGNGYDSTGAYGDLNDLWELNFQKGMWTWMGDSKTANAIGVYGTLGTPAPNNVPGGRDGSVSWMDSSGNLWLFGGAGYDSNGSKGYLNDLWEASFVNSTWTWMSGSNTKNAIGIYGTLGTPAPNNVPGGRYGSVSWIDSSGNLWLFGGVGYDSTGANGFLNDLWEFNPTNKEWTWVSGSSTVGTNGGQPGVYGTLGTPAASNVPGGRAGSVSWIDGSGNFWLLGGLGYDSTDVKGDCEISRGCPFELNRRS